ncbi:MAG: winged helix-turn-helix domain-containing protein [Sphingomonadales bacterium]|nr:winged helix-turn-helix domain-containing protein [Sphingomonadales bacterium]NCO47601.1 winged helix-turn-helix domain-containing protein [Sphingomonadales bacterium]NCO98925.1 winged helix-turn-helix domain-containing protein [Sphingomonadales bacterium]NCP26576.1 winged helix-turn-helix domain-containing protein [Sphingomonadales bacterium]NCP44292.1 winged helix-turn-helix domain-containing protein [Sphingomonadales bacterium]
MALRISNRTARWLWLQSQGLSETPTGPLDLAQTIRRLGFVQLDTIQNVTRAHHHILWSRNQNYREPMLDRLLGEDRAVFEHFTHDASVLPMEYYPMWQRQFRRLGEKVAGHASFQKALQEIGCEQILSRIEREGPLSTHAFDTKVEGKKQMWDRPPHKRVLDQLWYAGDLATSHRQNFAKYYDLAERVIPQQHREAVHDENTQIDWLCRNALDRLAFAALGEIQRFWGAVDAKEVRTWSQGVRDLVPVKLQSHVGDWRDALAPPDIEARLASVSAPTARLRIINPFDPVVRDRNRLSALFGFAYRNEMFVPAAQRLWGYYVYPLLERDRFVGRIEIKADRSSGRLRVTQFWPEPGILWTTGRQAKLDAELARLARLIDVSDISWDCDRA